MDRVRFGRALGYGARHAAKSLVKAAEAATSPNPSSASPTRSARQTASPLPRVAGRIVQAQQSAVVAQKHARTLGRSVWSPLARFSGVLWLQVTGTFFTLLALFLSQGLWKERATARLPIGSHAAAMFYMHALAFSVFTYFAISNFVRAHLRDRR